MRDTTNTEIYFCDTYALVEIAGGNLNYNKYADCVLITSDFNLMEFYFAMLRDYGKEHADQNYAIWSEHSFPLPKQIIKPAMELKLIYRRENLSYVDCAGYIFAKLNNVRFLTGDEKFETKENVEFVK